MKKLILGTFFVGSSLFAQYDGMLLTDDLGLLVNNNNVSYKAVKYYPKKYYGRSNEYYNILPYMGIMGYTGTTTKSVGVVSGLYLSDFKSPWKTEFDVEYSLIKYKDNTPTLKQNDFTLLVNYFQGYNLAYKFGIHYISSTDELTNLGKIFTLELLYYKTLKYNIGIDYYYSDYSNSTTPTTIKQISPKFGFNIGDYYSAIGSFYIETKIDYIQANKNYSSTEFKFNNYNGNFTTSLGIWMGERSFEVAKAGFVVNNSSIKQTGGFSISESYKIDKTSTLKLEYSKTNFEENGNSNSKVILASYSYSF